LLLLTRKILSPLFAGSGHCGAHENFPVPPLILHNTVNITMHAYFRKAGCRHLPPEKNNQFTYVTSMS